MNRMSPELLRQQHLRSVDKPVKITPCEYFTWYQLENECLFFSDCNFDSDSCTDCFTGTVNCSIYDCYEPGVCIDSVLLAHSYFDKPEECLEYCKSNSECKWFSHDPNNNNICALTSDCRNITTACASSGCVYGQVDCKAENQVVNIMVATGFNNGHLDDTEVLDTETITSCPNLPTKYPLEVDVAVGLQYDSKMVICGGSQYNGPCVSNCYSYSNDRWNIEAFKLEPARSGAMSVEIRPGEWLVMGGYADAPIHHLKDTQLLKNGIFTQGPDLPEPTNGGSCVMFNATHVFVAAASNDIQYSPNNYLLDINTEQWTRIADRNLSPYFFHSSGTFFNSTAGEIQVANIGNYGIEVYSPRDDSWHEVDFPSPIASMTNSATIQRGSDSFILIGGRTNVGYSSDIYLFDENGFSILKQNVLQLERSHHVAMPISSVDFTCV